MRYYWYWNNYIIVVIWHCHMTTSYCKMLCDGCMNAAWGLYWGGSRSMKRIRAFFRVKWFQPAMKGTFCARRKWLRSACLFFPRCNGGFKLLWVCLCVRSYRVFWNLRLQTAVEWLYDCCYVLLPWVSRHTGLSRNAGKCIVAITSRFLVAAALCIIFLFFCS